MFSAQDELAENQIPDPGYAGTQMDIEMESYEYDYYSYWDDIEYADDAYWDHGSGGGQKEPPQDGGTAGQKRKRNGPMKAGAIVDKRRKFKGARVARCGS